MNIVQTLGTITPRFVSFYPQSDTVLDAPLNSFIVRWNLQSKTRTLFHAHQDSVTILLKHPLNDKLVLSGSYEGKIRIWQITSMQDYEVVTEEVDCQCEKLTHACWSTDGNYLAVCCEGSKDSHGLVQVFKFVDGKQLKLHATIKGEPEFCFFTNDVTYDLMVVHERSSNNGCKLTWYDASKHYEAVHTESHPSTVNYAFMEQETGVNLPPRAALCMTDGSVLIWDLQTMKMVTTIEKPFMQKKSLPRYVLFEKNELVIGADNGKLTQWKLENNNATFVKEHSCPSGPIFFMAYSPTTNYSKFGSRVLWIATDQYVKTITINLDHDSTAKTVLQHELAFHDITCCGIAFSPDSKYLCVGDLSGHVVIWNVNCQKGHPMLKQFVGASVRCLTFRNCDNVYKVQIGAMDGTVYEWHFTDSPQFETVSFKTIAAFDGGATVVCMHWEHGKNPNRLAIGTSTGMLAVYQYGDDMYRLKFAILAHKPAAASEQFGSLDKFAEVWSVCWSPCNQYIATSSEDQSTVIWNMLGQQLHVLSGHSTAVTSIEWRKVHNEEFLVTCGDDKKVMVWKCNHTSLKTKWILHHVFSSDSHGLDWHTLTYLAIEKDPQTKDPRLCAATQNGYIFMWNLHSKKLIYKFKTHYGGIEGIAMAANHDFMATCSSDCTINIYQLSKM